MPADTPQPLRFSFIGMNNVTDPAALNLENGESPSIVNMDTDPANVSLRKGYTSALSGAAHSGWSNGSTAYLVKAGYLCSFNGTATTNLIAVNPVLRMDYCAVNNLILATNGQQYIVIENGVASLSTAPPGRYITFYNGRVYTASGGVLQFTNAFDVETCDSRQQYIPISGDDITGLVAVDDGIYVGTTKEALFLAGSDFSDMALRCCFSFGVVHGTMKQIEGAKLKLNGKAAVWASHRGFCIGTTGGQVKNISDGVYSLPEVMTGSSMIREENGRVDFLSVLGTGTGFNIYEPPEFDMTEY